MNESNIDAVLKHLDMFEKYNIGLITISKNKKVNIVFKTNATEPYAKDLYKKASIKFNEFEFNLLTQQQFKCLLMHKFSLIQKENTI